MLEVIVDLLWVAAKVHNSPDELAYVLEELRGTLLSCLKFLHHVVHVKEHLLKLDHLVHLLSFGVDDLYRIALNP